MIGAILSSSSARDAVIAVLAATVAALVRTVWRLAERVARLEGESHDRTR